MGAAVPLAVSVCRSLRPTNGSPPDVPFRRWTQTPFARRSVVVDGSGGDGGDPKAGHHRGHQVCPPLRVLTRLALRHRRPRCRRRRLVHLRDVGLPSDTTCMTGTAARRGGRVRAESERCAKASRDAGGSEREWRDHRARDGHEMRSGGSEWTDDPGFCRRCGSLVGS